jgi:hypothetical protein
MDLNGVFLLVFTDGILLRLLQSFSSDGVSSGFWVLASSSVWT